MKIKNPAVSLFSDTLDAETAALVRRIPGQYDRFGTDFIGVDGQIAVRLEAWRAKDGHAWAIDRFTYAPALDRIEQAVEARPGLCFFDALYHCARFETAELAGHEARRVVTIADPEWVNPPSWRMAAEAASQIVGDDGLPRPCPSCRVLIGGVFSTAALKTARRTGEETLLPADEAPRQELTQTLLAHYEAQGPSSDRNALEVYRRKLASRRDEETLKKLFNDAVQAGEALTRGIERLTENKFARDISIVSGLLTVGLRPLAGFLSGDPRYAPQRHYSLLTARFRQCVDRVPDGPEKVILRDFARKAGGALWLERAARLIANDQAAGRHREDRIRLAVDYIGRAGQAEDLSKVDIGRLESECLDKGLPPFSAASALRSAWDISSIRVLAPVYGWAPDTRIGSRLPDLTILAGFSPSTGRLLFTADDYGRNKFLSALIDGHSLRDYHGRNGSTDTTKSALLKALRQGTHDHGWRLPTLDELDVLYKNKNRGALPKSFTSWGEKNYWSNQQSNISCYYLNMNNGSRRASAGGVDNTVKFVFS